MIRMGGSAPMPWMFAVRLYKWRFRTPEALIKGFPQAFEKVPAVGELIIQEWDRIEPMSIADLFENNFGDNTRRLMFQIVGPEAIFDQFRSKKMLGKATVDVKFVNPNTGQVELKPSSYELHLIEDQRFPGGRSGVIICWDTTTNKKHYLYCFADGEHISKKDPLAAMASLCYSPVNPSKLEAIYRQGEVYFFVIADKGKNVELLPEAVPLTKDQYWKLIQYQS